MDLEKTRINKIYSDIDEAVNSNINCTYDDFLINNIMEIVEKEIIKAFNTGVYLGDQRNYLGEEYLNEIIS